MKDVILGRIMSLRLYLKKFESSQSNSDAPKSLRKRIQTITNKWEEKKTIKIKQ